MGELIAEVLPLALAVALSPLPILPAILLLFTQKPRAAGFSFLAGWVVGVLGSTILFGGVWFVLVLLSGLSMRKVAYVGAAGVVAVTATYFLYDNARHRIDAFLGGGTAYDQVDLAQRTLLAGGWTGSGLWLGTRKLSLPEAHTDYIFSVIGEEM